MVRGTVAVLCLSGLIFVVVVRLQTPTPLMTKKTHLSLQFLRLQRQATVLIQDLGLGEL